MDITRKNYNNATPAERIIQQLQRITITLAKTEIFQKRMSFFVSPISDSGNTKYKVIIVNIFFSSISIRIFTTLNYNKIYIMGKFLWIIITKL